MRNSIVAILVFTATWVVADAWAADESPPTAPTSAYSEERNAATAYAGTLNFYIGRMAVSCKSLLQETDAYPGLLVAKWKSEGSNGRFLSASIAYQGGLLAAVQKTSGKDAMLALLKQIQHDVQSNGQGAVDDQLKGSEAQKMETCKRFVANVEKGALNITPASSHYQTLVELAGMLPK